MAQLLIVEDEARMRRLLEMQLTGAGHRVTAVADAEQGLARLEEGSAELVITDLRLPGMDGLAFLQAIKREHAALPVVVMTAHGTVETAVEAMKAGAADYLLKPFSLEELSLVVEKELHVAGLQRENESLREAVAQRYDFPNIIGRGERMQQALAMVARVAASDSTVLLGGESGVGKDLIARALHQHSRRATGPFIKINSAAIPENLLESELFGYEKGAFTGAVRAKPGKFELADQGTLFLDEIGDVPLGVQAKLLRVLQEREFERLGATRTLKVNVRLIAATNRNLRAALEEGSFREDLYYRLNVVPIELPPLREHKEDIPELAELFLRRFAARAGKPLGGFTAAAIERLMACDWPGNVRELENIIERAVALADSPTLDVADIRLELTPPSPPTPGGALLPAGWTLEQWEQQVIRDALRRANGNKSQAARLLGLSRNALRYRLSTMGDDDQDVVENHQGG
ncbi:MAG TPA: sigma-54 dependent transcriptional regulator [Terriglobales bacterium]